MASRLLTSESATVPLRQTFFGRSIYCREGRRIGVVKTQAAGRAGGNLPYSIIELASYARAAADLRAIPLSKVSYSKEAGHFLCDMSEMSIRSAPVFTGSADWLDDRWTQRLDAYFDTI